MPIDWSKAAWLAARGARPAEIIEAVGCSRSQLRRRQRQCPLFRALMEQYGLALAGVEPPSAGGGQERATRGPTGRTIVDTARDKLEQEIIDGNVKVAMWLAERLRLFSPDDKGGADATLRRLLETMTEAERAAFSRPD